MSSTTYKVKDWPAGKAMETAPLFVFDKAPQEDMLRDMIFHWIKSKLPETTCTVTVDLEIKVGYLRDTAEYRSYSLQVETPTPKAKDPTTAGVDVIVTKEEPLKEEQP